METAVLIVVLCVVVAGFASQWAAWKLGMPAIVVLLLAGLLIGPVFNLLNPTESFGPPLRPLIGLIVAIVVFEGGLSLDLRELRTAGEGVLRLTALALPLNWIFGALAGHFIGGLAWPAALLFGAILVVTGPTVILPLLRQSRLRQRPASFLKWEAIVNDPIGAVLAVIVLEILIITAHDPDGGEPFLTFALRLVAGVALALALGVASALLVREAFHRDQVPEILKTPMLLSLTLGIYAVSNVVMEEAGLIAATVFGIALANLRITGIEELRRFKEALVVLLVSALFIVLTADLDTAAFAQLSWPILALTLTVLFLVRPAAIMLATVGSRMTLGERLLVAWIAPRGIVAAAVAGVAGLRLEEAGYVGAELIQPTVFAVIAVTVVAHGFTLRPLARRLGLTAGDKPGLAIVGATSWTTSLAGTLSRAGVPTVLVDTFPGALDEARDKGLATMQAEILSEHGSERLAGRAVDYLLAATPDEIYNALTCARLAPELGRERVFQIAPNSGRVDRHYGPSLDWRGKTVMGTELSHERIVERFEQGWRFTTIPVDQPGTIAELVPAGDAAALLILRAGGRLDFLSPEGEKTATAASGDRILLFAAP